VRGPRLTGGERRRSHRRRARPRRWAATSPRSPIFIALIGVAWHPLRLILPAVVVSMIASAMGGRHQRLAFASVIVVAFCFFLRDDDLRGSPTPALVAPPPLLQQVE